MKKIRITTALLVASMVMSSLSFTALADETECYDPTPGQTAEADVQDGITTDESGVPDETEVDLEELIPDEIEISDETVIPEVYENSVEVIDSDVSEDAPVIEVEEPDVSFEESYALTITREQMLRWAESQVGKDCNSWQMVDNYCGMVGGSYISYKPYLWSGWNLGDNYNRLESGFLPGDLVFWKRSALTEYEGLSTVNTQESDHIGVITNCYANGFVSVDYDTEAEGKAQKRFHYYSELSFGFRPINFSDSYNIESALTGWQKIGNVWYFFDADGIAVTGERTISGKHYFFNDDATMFTGWRQVGNKWYYYGGSGYVTGWYKIGKSWYYFNSSGAMLTGWQKLSGKWYYFNSSGKMLTGWQKLSGKWYFFESSGAMKTGWYKTGGKWYYFNSSGVMATGSVKIGNKTYRFNSSGVCLNP